MSKRPLRRYQSPPATPQFNLHPNQRVDRIAPALIAGGGVMAEMDLLIKGGTVVDGTRVPRYRADVWIKDGKIAQIGGRGQSFAKKTIDADGLVVAPGFIDLHTHYDAQIRWDPYCTISGWHGVTSLV